MITPENATRKLDSLGRVTLPKGLRDRLVLKENDEMELFTAVIDDRQYILLSRPVDENEINLQKINSAIKVLEKAGYEVSKGE